MTPALTIRSWLRRQPIKQDLSVDPASRAPISDAPIFILASGWRCGSTLLQRLLNSHTDILIWGEQRGYLNRFLQEFSSLLTWQTQHALERDVYLTKGYDTFTPNMLPARQQILDAAVAHLKALFGGPAYALDKSTWGFKEVRYDASIAMFLQDCFPQSRFIHLTRHITDCFISLKHWENQSTGWTREWTELHIAEWQRINASFLTMKSQTARLLQVKYEDMVADPHTFCTRLETFLHIAPDQFDRTVFAKRLHNFDVDGVLDRRPLIRPSDLDPTERMLLSKDSVVEIATAYGYEIKF